MEDIHKILKVEYLSNHLLGHTQILKLGLDDQTIFYKFLKQRRPSMEDDFNACRIWLISSWEEIWGELRGNQPSLLCQNKWTDILVCMECVHCPDEVATYNGHLV